MPAVLGLDTSTATLAVGASEDGRVLAERTVGPDQTGRPRHARALLVAVDEVLAEVGGWDAVGKIAVGSGPGTFTGLRIGVATARALAQARELRLSAVSSLAALAAGHEGPGAVTAVIDAKRGEVFTATFAAGGEQDLEPTVCPPDDLARSLAALDGGVSAIGDGAVLYRQVLESSGAVIPADDDPAHTIQARALCALGAAAEPVPIETVEPTYLRRPDAELWRERVR